MRTYPLEDRTSSPITGFEVEEHDVNADLAARILGTVAGVSEIRVRGLFERTGGIHVWFRYGGRRCAVYEPFGDNSRWDVIPIEGVEPIDLAEIERAFRERPPLWYRRLADRAAQKPRTLLLYTVTWLVALLSAILVPGLPFPFRLVFALALILCAPAWADLQDAFLPNSWTSPASEPRRRWNQLLVVSFCGIFVIGTLMVILQARWMEIILFAFVAIFGALSMQLRCPRCGQRLLFRPVIRGSRWIGWWSPFLRKRCLKCDLPI